MLLLAGFLPLGGGHSAPNPCNSKLGHNSSNLQTSPGKRASYRSLLLESGPPRPLLYVSVTSWSCSPCRSVHSPLLFLSSCTLPCVGACVCPRQSWPGVWPLNATLIATASTTSDLSHSPLDCYFLGGHGHTWTSLAQGGGRPSTKSVQHPSDYQQET